jgi:hypothetical protein
LSRINSSAGDIVFLGGRSIVEISDFGHWPVDELNGDLSPMMNAAYYGFGADNLQAELMTSSKSAASFS